MADPAVEVDLTKSTPTKTLKQARLPFAPINKSASKGLSDSGKKRKLENEPLESKKVAKLDVEETVSDTSIKSKLAAFRNDQENSEKVEEEVAKENETPAVQEDVATEVVGKKPKQKKSKATKEVKEADVKEKDDSDTSKSGKFTSLLKLPFKKKDKKCLAKQPSDEDIDLDDGCALLEPEDSDVKVVEAGEEKEVESDTEISMTEEWASFHEVNPHAVEPVGKVLKASTPKSKTKPDDKLKLQEENSSSPKPAKPKAKKKAIKAKKEETEATKPVEAPATPVTEKKSEKPKEGPLSKFFTKTKLPSVIPKADTDIEVISIQKVVTPARTSPRKKTSQASLTPLAGKVAVAKLKVQLTELAVEMEAAVAAADYLKAHDKKVAIARLEEEVRVMEGGQQESGDSSTASPTSQGSMTTPKSGGRVVSKVSTPGSASLASPALARKLTPGQVKKKEEAAKKREALEAEKKAKKEELDKKKEEERVERERKKEVEKRAREVVALEKERERKEKELEKEKDKREKEGEREKKKVEKELLLKEKEEEKKAQEVAEKEKLMKKAQAFKSFFKKDNGPVKVDDSEKDEKVEEVRGNFTVFRVKKNMRLAPTVRGDPISAMSRLDSLDMPCGPEGLYIARLKTGHTPGRQARTWPYEAKTEDNDVTVLDVEEEDSLEDLEEDGGQLNFTTYRGAGEGGQPRAKLLQFHLNQRPAYWGTWTKTSSKVSGRRPFARDEERFEYDYESDDDWEEEEEGEDLADEDEKDKEEDKDEKDAYEVDNEFFVPHGYLSDEEEEKDEEEVFDPEKAKEKLKLREQEFEAEQKKKTHQLKPRLWGVYWEDEQLDTGAAAGQLVKILGSFSAVVEGGNNNLPINTSFSKPVGTPEDMDAMGGESAKGKGGRGRPGKEFPQECLPDLVRLLHANPNNKMFLAREFLEFWRRKTGGEEGGVLEGGTPSSQGTGISKRAMINKILELGEWTRQGRQWLVRPEILEKLELCPASPNEWTYILEQPNKRAEVEAEVASRPVSPAPASPAANLITKFARVLSKEEKEEQRIKREKFAAEFKQKKEEQKAKADEARAEALAKADYAKRQEQRKAALAKNTAKTAGPKGKVVNTIAVKKTPGTASPKVVNAVRKTPKAGSPAGQKAAKEKASLGLSDLPSGILVTKVESSPKIMVRKDLASPKIGVRKDLLAASPTAVKRPAGAVASPIPIKKDPGARASPIAIKKAPGINSLGFALASPIAVKPGSEASPATRSSPRKKPRSSGVKPSTVVQKVAEQAVDLITIDD